MLKVILTIVLVHLLGLGLLACTLSIIPAKEFDAWEYIFIGKVVGYEENVEFKKTVTGIDQKGHTRWSSGLRMETLEIVWPHDSNISVFEIFEFRTNPDCSYRGVNAKEIRDEYPIGMELRVVSKMPVIIPSTSEGLVQRLEVRFGSQSSISPNRDSQGNQISSAGVLFDYRSPTAESNHDQLAKQSQPSFEIRKDLLRLKESDSQAERNKILDRIVLVPRFAIYDFDLESILKGFTSNEAEFKRYQDLLLGNWMKNEKYREYNARLQAAAEKPLQQIK